MKSFIYFWQWIIIDFITFLIMFYFKSILKYNNIVYILLKTKAIFLLLLLRYTNKFKNSIKPKAYSFELAISITNCHNINNLLIKAIRIIKKYY